MKDFLDRFDALPIGAFDMIYEGALWRAVRTDFSDGRSQKLVAHEAGGNGYVSLNLYRLEEDRALLRPCEMPREAAEDFVLNARQVGRTGAKESAGPK